MEQVQPLSNPAVLPGPQIFPGRTNSQGFDLTDEGDLARIEAARAPFVTRQFEAGPMLAGRAVGGLRLEVNDPATGARVGQVLTASEADVVTALRLAEPWAAEAPIRAEILRRAADLYEENFGQIFALLAREAGKTLSDAVAELREAVDFLRYYANGAEGLTHPARGIFACISPWNFPLAIFSGQIAAALAAGNAVLAKPAEQTPLIAGLAVELLLQAGVPPTALQLLPGDGVVGAALTRTPQVAGVAFTGSTETALLIRRSMAEYLDPGAVLIAETGGLNAMIVDSTALPEQAVRDIIASSFQSAGQRCSALRCLYLQEDIAPHVTEMLFGAMDLLKPGTPWELTTDLGPVIDAEAQTGIRAHVEQARAEGRLAREIKVPGQGTFVAPAVIRIAGIKDMQREIFGPVLHLATFKSGDLDRVIADINDTGYGLTFGLHTRIDDRVQKVVEQLNAGNAYVNRNQIGAVVGSQPFGGEGLSGTGPKAGGPEYLERFTVTPTPGAGPAGAPTTQAEAAALLAAPRAPIAPVVLDLPGPTGESNRLSLVARAPLLCLGPGAEAALAQAEAVRALGGQAVEAPDLAADALSQLAGFAGALWWGDAATARAYAKALTARSGPILPLITGQPDRGHAVLERHVCIDTTASGGNAKLLAEVAED